jgi:zinc protease
MNGGSVPGNKTDLRPKLPSPTFLTVLLALLLCSFPSRGLAVPPIEQAKLSNGLKILLIQAHNVPMVSMQLTLVAGSRFDPKEKGGTASLLADMLTDHTAKHDQKSWAQYLDTHAIMLGADVDRDSMAVSVTVLKEVLTEGVAALAETVLQPGWDQKRFRILKEDAVSAAQKAREQPGHIASETTVKVLFDGHPYGHLPQGNVESLARIALADLKTLYEKQIHPQGAVLAVSGDVTMKELLALIRPALKSWKGCPDRKLFDLKPANHKPSNISVSMDSKQTHLVFARLGPARKDPDLFPVLVLNHILGGSGFASILMQEVREKRGLVYGVYSYFRPLAAAGPYIINLQTKASQRDKAAHVVRSQLLGLSTKGVSKRQLRAAKSNLIGGFAQRMDSNRERVGLLSMIGFYDLPLDYLQVWTKRIKSVRLAQVNKAAKKYCPPEQWSLVQVGPTSVSPTN